MVINLEGKYITGWAFICVLSLTIVFNFGPIMFKDIVLFIKYLKVQCKKRCFNKQKVKIGKTEKA